MRYVILFMNKRILIDWLIAKKKSFEARVERALCRSFAPKRHSQMRVKDLPKVGVPYVAARADRFRLDLSRSIYLVLSNTIWSIYAMNDAWRWWWLTLTMTSLMLMTTTRKLPMNWPGECRRRTILLRMTCTLVRPGWHRQPTGRPFRTVSPPAAQGMPEDLKYSTWGLV